jgi:hypothetical protein
MVPDLPDFFFDLPDKLGYYDNPKFDVTKSALYGKVF